MQMTLGNICSYVVLISRIIEHCAEHLMAWKSKPKGNCYSMTECITIEDYLVDTIQRMAQQASC